VRPSSKTFLLRLKRFDSAKGGRKTHVVTLGEWPRYGLAQARAEAHARAVHSTVAPRVSVAEALERHRRAHEDEGRLDERWREQTRKSYATYRRYLVERMGPRPMDDVQRAEISTALRDYAKRGAVAANRLASFTISFWNWALGEGLTESNPTAQLGDKQKQPGGGEEPRNRVLSDAEIRELWRLDSENANLLRALLLTGCRIAELQRASTAHIDGDWLVIPVEHSKNAKAHRVYLVPEARKQFNGRAPALFRGVSATAVQAWVRRMQLDVDGDESPRAPWAGMRPRDSVTGKPMSAWTPHDLRRTFVTLAAKAKVPEHIIVRMINQTPIGGGISSTLGVYQQHEYLEERRAGTLAVATKVAEIARG
jgi:integrase